MVAAKTKFSRYWCITQNCFATKIRSSIKWFCYIINKIVLLILKNYVVWIATTLHHKFKKYLKYFIDLHVKISCTQENLIYLKSIISAIRICYEFFTFDSIKSLKIRIVLDRNWPEASAGRGQGRLPDVEDEFGHPCSCFGFFLLFSFFCPLFLRKLSSFFNWKIPCSPWGKSCGRPCIGLRSKSDKSYKKSGENPSNFYYNLN